MIDTTTASTEATESTPKASSKRRLVAIGAAGLTLLAGIGVVWSKQKGGSAGATAEVTPDADVPVHDGNLIRYSAGFARRIGIQQATVSQLALSPRIQVSGTIAHDPRKVAEIGARIEGRISRLLVVEGDDVREGQPLVEIESAELGRAQADVRSARAKEIAARANFEREQQLVAAQVTTSRDLEVARAEAESASAERVAAEQTVRALGGGRRGDAGRLVLRSPIAGRVVHAPVRNGETVAPTDTLITVADASTLWTELAVFEGDLSAIRAGDAVQLSPQMDDDLVLEGTVEHVGEVIDLQTRTAKVRVSISNENRVLRVGQSVTAFIQTSGERRSGLAVPRSAVVRVDGVETVFVFHEENAVEPRRVVTGAHDAESIAIIEGLREGDRVVSAGTFLLKSELFR